MQLTNFLWDLVSSKDLFEKIEQLNTSSNFSFFIIKSLDGSKAVPAQPFNCSWVMLIGDIETLFK